MNYTWCPNTKHLVRSLHTKNCDVNVVKQIISRGVDLHFRDKYHDTLIHLALKHCEDKFLILQELLAAGVPVNVPNRFKRSAMHYAVKYSDDMRVLRELIAHKADVESSDMGGISPLHLAVQGNKKSVVELLILHSEFGIIEQGAKALIFAVKNDNFEIVKLLLSSGASPTGYHTTPLVEAVDCRVINRSILIELMSYGAKWSVYDPRRYSALHEVVYSYGQKKSSKGPLNSNASNNLLSAETLMKCYVLRGRTNIQYLCMSFEKYKIYSKLMDLYNECLVEIDRMQEEFISGNFCIFDFVREGFRQNPIVQKKKASRETVFNQIINLSRNYPAYAEIIAHHLGRSDLHLKSMEVCVYALKDERRIFLSPEVVFLIAGFLSDVDILHLIIAFSDFQHFASH